MPKDLRAKIEKKLKALREIKRLFGDTLEFYISLQAQSHPEWLDKEGQPVNYRIYKRVDLTKDTFSKMLNNREYHPSKLSVCKIAFALELDLEQTEDLLRVAGYDGLSKIDPFDIIFGTFIEEKVYDVRALDDALWDQGQPAVGSVE